MTHSERNLQVRGSGEGGQPTTLKVQAFDVRAADELHQANLIRKISGRLRIRQFDRRQPPRQLFCVFNSDIVGPNIYGTRLVRRVQGRALLVNYLNPAANSGGDVIWGGR